MGSGYEKRVYGMRFVAAGCRAIFEGRTLWPREHVAVMVSRLPSEERPSEFYA